MKRRRVPLAQLAVGALALAVLAGCAQGTGDDSGGKSATFDPDQKLSGSLTVMGFGASDEIATTRLAEAKKALGDVKVKLVEGELDIQQFLSAVAAGDPPEIIYADRNEIGSFASRGAIMPLTDCIDGEGIDTSVFRKPALDQVTFDDQVFGIPEFNVVQIIQANGDLLDQAGLTTAYVNGSDWDAVTAASKELSKTENGKLTVIGFDS